MKATKQYSVLLELTQEDAAGLHKGETNHGSLPTM